MDNLVAVDSKIYNLNIEKQEKKDKKILKYVNRLSGKLVNLVLVVCI